MRIIYFFEKYLQKNNALEIFGVIRFLSIYTHGLFLYNQFHKVFRELFFSLLALTVQTIDINCYLNRPDE